MIELSPDRPSAKISHQKINTFLMCVDVSLGTGRDNDLSVELSQWRELGVSIVFRILSDGSGRKLASIVWIGASSTRYAKLYIVA